MNYELTGKLFEKFTTMEVGDKGFIKREFVVETEENNYKQHVKLQLTKDKCSLLDQMNVGDEVKCVLNINGRRWEKDDKVSYFNTLDCWKLELVESGGVQQEPDLEFEATPDGDLPF